MNRREFARLAKKLIDELVADHEEHTGVTETEQMTFKEWLDELDNLHTNTCT